MTPSEIASGKALAAAWKPKAGVKQQTGEDRKGERAKSRQD